MDVSNMSDTIENILILQGGGSLGAFGYEVFKALANSNIKIDIIAGTSIGGLNASIIAGNKEEEHPEKALEQFWLELAEGSTSKSNANFNFPFVESLLTMLGNVKKYIDMGRIAIDPQENKELLTELRIATANEDMLLQKDQTNTMDLLDSLRLAMCIIK
jgi:predicted acylesterase/phospholipase RssA